MSLTRLFSAAGSGDVGGVGVGSFGGTAFAGWAASDAAWPWVTAVLSVSVAAGYCAIAVNWFFQSKLSRHAESRAALRRLRNISILCAAFGVVLYSRGDNPWYLWRAYDAALLVLAVHAWTFVIRTRGLGLVNERLKQFDELERSATKYREIAELLPHMVWTATADGRVDFSNQRWHEYAGYDHTWLEALHPDDREHAWARWNEALASREPVSIEARLRKAATDGVRETYRTFVIRATPIVRGDALKWLGACADVEDQKQLAAEKEMQARQKTFFLNALSHDIRAPLHNVLLNAHLLKTSVTDEADAESVQMIVENAVAAGDLVTKLLDFAKVGAQDHNDIERLSLGALLQQIARRFGPVAEQKGLYLRVADPDADVFVLSDRQKLERIISNLVDNAIKYTSRGGVTLDLVARNGEASVEVHDTGVGVSSEHVPHLFDEFYQVNNYERDRSKGFGMGLAICRSLARHVGGDVRLERTSGEGSCFAVVVRDQQQQRDQREQHEREQVGLDRGGRPRRADGDQQTAEAPGLCGV